MKKVKMEKTKTWVHLMVRPDTAKTIALIKAREQRKRPYHVTNDIIIREALDAYTERKR